MIRINLTIYTAAFLGAALCAQPVRSADILKSYVESFNADDTGLEGQISNKEALDFLEKNVPRLECPDKELERTYYFRWWTYRKHISKSPAGYVITEFLPEVPWARQYNTINCPAGHHFREGRWLHDSEILSDYARFYFGGGGKPRQYSFWAADSVLQFCNVTGDHALAVGLLDKLVENYRIWEKEKLCDDGLFWQIDDRDGMESSIGGSGKRATINSYMYGDATAIAAIAAMADRPELQKEFASKAATLRKLINDKLWCEEHQFYKTIPYAPPNRKDKLGKTCDAGPWVDVRELHGYTPWYFSVPEPRSTYQEAWRQLMDNEGFLAPFGPTTAEQRHPDFKLSYDGHECQWNGPSWPFSTSVTLTAMANVLQDYPEPLPITKADYLKTLQTYAYSHRLTREDGKKVCWIDENLNPLTGDWISRTVMINRRAESKKTGKNIFPGQKIVERGKDYNHSSFCDLVISGLFGLQPRLDKKLVIKPLIPEGEWDWCRLENIRYHGHILTIQWDREGEKYQQGAGFQVFADGKLIGSSKTLGELTLELP